MQTNTISRQFYAAYRDPDLAVLEGFHPARHALTFGARLELAVTYDWDKLRAIAERLAPETLPSIEAVLEVVDRQFFDKLSPRSLSSPLLSFAPRPAVDLQRVLDRTGRPIVYLERPRNPGNVGAVIRVAAAAGIEAVLVSGDVDPWSPVVLRSGTGLQYTVAVGSAQLPSETDRPIVAVDADGEPLQSALLDPNAILAIGGERYGLSAQVREMAQRSVSVPMRPGVSSLNLSTAVAAVLFSWKSAASERTGSSPW